MSIKAQFIDADKYHAMDGWSSTQVKTVVRHSIERALIPLDDTPALSFGRTMHDYFESPTGFNEKYAVFDDTDIIRSIRARRPDITAPAMTKDYKQEKAKFEAENSDKTIVSLQDYDTLRSMYESVTSSSFYRNRIQSTINEGADVVREGSFFAPYETEYGVIQLKARPDLMILGNGRAMIVDWKSCGDASQHAFRRDFFKYLYDKGKGNAPKRESVGEVLYNRAVINAMIDVEAIRTAMGKFGNKPLTGEQVRWGMEHLNITEQRLEELGMKGMTRPLQVTCENHESNGQALVQQWDGKKWNVVSDWIEPMRDVVRPKLEEAAVQEGQKLGYTMRDCAKEQ